MKWVVLIGLFVFAFSITSCGDKTPSEKAKTAGEAVSDAAKTTGDAVGGAIEATGDYLTQSKDDGVKAAQQKLEEIEKSWQDLLAKADPTTSEARADLQKAKDQMAMALAEANAKLAEAKTASDDKWKENVKPALDESLLKAKKLYEDTYTRFGGK